MASARSFKYTIYDSVNYFTNQKIYVFIFILIFGVVPPFVLWCCIAYGMRKCEMRHGLASAYTHKKCVNTDSHYTTLYCLFRCVHNDDRKINKYLNFVYLYNRMCSVYGVRWLCNNTFSHKETILFFPDYFWLRRNTHTQV